jgi:outer membrane protein TolC
MEGNQIMATQEEAAAIDRLNYYLGAPPEERYQCQTVVPFTSLELEKSPEQLLEIAFSKRPEFARLTAAKERARSEKNAARSDFLPWIIGVATAGDLQGTTLLEEQHYSVGVGLRIPLFDGLKTPAEFQKTKLEQTRLEHEMEQLKNQIVSEVNQAYRGYQKTRMLLALSKTRRTEANQALRLAKERYLNKSGILADWDQAWRAWSESEVVYWKLIFAYQMSVAELRMALGEI